MKKSDKQSNENITRKEAFQKAGKYAAFTASTMFLLLNTKNAAASPAPPTDW
jgi:hypothetical protein